MSSDRVSVGKFNLGVREAYQRNAERETMLKSVLETIEGLPPELVEHYVEKDGKHFLAIESIDGLELSNVAGLKSTLGKQKEEVKRLKTQLGTFDDLDPIKAREALGKMDEIANWTPDQKAVEIQEAFEAKVTAKLEKDRLGQLAKFEEEQGKLNTRNKLLEKELYDTKINMTALKAIRDAGGEPELLMHKVTSSMQIREDNGKFEVVILDPTGAPRITPKPGEYETPMTVDEYVQELKAMEVLAPAFKGSGATGSGATNSSSIASGAAHTITAKQAADYPTFKRLRAAAEKAGETLRPVP